MARTTANSTSNGGVGITPAEATENPTHAQWLQGDCKRYLEATINVRKMPNEIHSYTELQQQIHDDLRNQHPDWVEPNGNCPTCDSYESRLAELLGLSRSLESHANARIIIRDESCRSSLVKYRTRG